MKLTLESTDELFQFQDDRPLWAVPFRIWRGTTEHGTLIIALIPAIGAPADSTDPQLENELHALPWFNPIT
jgi:hypothetical protein